MSTSKWGKGSGMGWQDHDRKFQEIISTGFNDGEPYPIVKMDGHVLPDFTKRVHAGMDLMDKVLPGWQDEITLDMLDLESDQNCVLGQAFPLYAKATGYMEFNKTEYQKFADAVIVVGDNVDDGQRNGLAAAFGFALSETDFHAINSQSMREVCGNPPDETKLWANNAMLAKLSSAGDRYTAMFWEHLTKTWIREIQKAREEGRWAASASSASTSVDESAPTVESTSISSDAGQELATTTSS